MKISLVTAVYNRRDTIEESIDSVRMQSYQNIEHVIIDGASTDGTLELLLKLSDKHTKLVSEKDDGIYDALNKGIAHASGDVIGLIHSDDIFAHNRVLAKVAEAFADPQIDAVYGDLQYVSNVDITRIIRHWKAGEFIPSKLRNGWMPPHPTLFLRREVFEKYGCYDTAYRIAADYEAILRWFGKSEFKAHYLPEVMVKMRVGGESNKSLRKIIVKSREDYRAIRSNNIGGIRTLIWKNLSKVKQFLLPIQGVSDD